MLLFLLYSLYGPPIVYLPDKETLVISRCYDCDIVLAVFLNIETGHGFSSTGDYYSLDSPGQCLYSFFIPP